MEGGGMEGGGKRKGGWREGGRGRREDGKGRGDEVSDHHNIKLISHRFRGEMYVSVKVRSKASERGGGR